MGPQLPEGQRQVVRILVCGAAGCKYAERAIRPKNEVGWAMPSKELNVLNAALAD